MMTIEQKLRAIMKATGWKQAQLAERFNVTQATVSRWFSGSEPEGARWAAINDLYEHMLSEAPKDTADAVVPLMGYIGAGAEIEPEFEQTPPEGLDQVGVPFPVPDDMIAFKVKGDSMLPVFKDGSVVIVFREQKRPLEAFYGEEAAVRTSDGRRFIKTVMRGITGVNLLSWNAPPIENVKLDWVGEIFAILPPAVMKRTVIKGA
jgi:repressor LexA